MRCAIRSMAAPSAQAEQGPGVARAEHACGDASLHEGRQLEQAQRVGDLWTGATDALGELLVRAAEVIEQLLVGRRLLERVELAAMEVLEERVAQEVVVVGVLDDRRDDCEIGRLRSPASAARP